jgi:hypothetical protein
MNNDEAVTQKQKWITKRKARFYALSLIVPAILCLIFSVKTYFTGSYLRVGAPLDPDQVVIMVKMLKCAIFGLMPSLSILMIMCSRLIWKLSNQLNNENSK